MASEREVIATEHANKLRELFFLVSSALQPLPDYTYLSASTTATNFFDKNDVSTAKPFQIASISKVRDYDTLKREIAGNAKRYLYQAEEKNSNGKRPREAAFELTNEAFRDLANSLPSGIPLPEGKSRRIQTTVNLRSQVEGIEREKEEFLHKRISDLDIVALPDHYPTQVHDSTSLAELYYRTQSFPLIKLLPGSHKALMTENFELALLEGKISVLYSRIEELKRQNKWSLRQPMRYYDPFVYVKRNKKAKEHTWDSLVREAKWMATDFKELQKFKKYCCAQIAQAVRDYWTFGQVMCIKTKPIEFLPLESTTEGATDTTTEATSGSTSEVASEITTEGDSEAVPEVVSDMAVESNDLDSEMLDIPEKQEDSNTADQPESNDLDSESAITDIATDENHSSDPGAVEAALKLQTDSSIDPSQLSKIDGEDETFALDLHTTITEPAESPATITPFKSHININDLKKLDQSIIRNLPKYTAFDDDPLTPLLTTIPVTEISLIPGSRMLYPLEADDDWYKIVLRDSATPQPSGEESGPPPYQKGLFGVQSHRKFNFLKPPKPPLVKNIKFRSPTIWLPRDDQLLIHYVAEYCFNWELISANLLAHPATLKHYTSNIEKRTPWQCFERYIQLNDKFQFRDMKGSNAAPAQIWLEEAHNAQMSTKRRISPFGVGTESIQRGHKKLRWASMFDAMRKTMRKRELAAAKANSRKAATPEYASNTINNNASGYAAGQTSKRSGDVIPTPQELTKMKHDQDQVTQEVYFQRQASRSRLKPGIGQRRPDQSGGATSSPPVGPMDSVSSGPSRATVDAQRRMQQQRAAQLAAASSSDSSRPSLTALQNGLPAGMPGQLSHVALAQHQAKQLLGNMKAALSNSKPLTTEQMQKAFQIEKQRLLLQQKNQGGAGSPNPRVSSQMMAGRKVLDSATHPGSSPTMLGASSAASSPSAKQTALAKGPIQYSPAQFAKIVSTIQQKNPNMSKEQAKKVAVSYLANIQQQQQASRTSQNATASSSAQEALKARQAHLTARKTTPGKEDDRSKMVLTQDSYLGRASSPYTRTGASRTNSPLDTSLQYPTNQDEK